MAAKQKPLQTFRNKKLLFLIIVIEALILRYLAATQGGNTDFDSYQIVAGIVNQGGNVYAETSRYNYSPLWAYLLGFFAAIANMFANSQLVFKLLLVSLLSFADVAAAIILVKRFGYRAGALLLLNPLLILATGFNLAFDNLALMFGLLALVNYEKGKEAKGFLFMAVSLLVKHTLIFLPIWFMLRSGSKKQKLMRLMPLVIWSLAFVPFLLFDSSSVIRNVLAYRPNNYAPLYNMLMPVFLQNIVSADAIFLLAMLIAGILLRRHRWHLQFFYYLMLLVIWAPAVLHSYLAVPVVATSFFAYPVLVVYSLYSSYLYLLDGLGMSLAFFIRTAPSFALTTKAHGDVYDIPVLMLAIAFLLVAFRRQTERLITFVKKSLKQEYTFQKHGFANRAKS